MSTPQTRRWSPDRRRAEPTSRGARAASWVVGGLALVLLWLVAKEAISLGLLDGFMPGGWR